MTITDEGIRLDCPLADTLHRRNVELTECYLKLYEKYLEYKISAVYESDDRLDAEGIWTDTKTNYRWTRLRAAIVQVDMYYDNPADKWMVSLEFDGIADSIGWLHDSPKDALKLYNTLQDYFITR